MIFLRVVVFFCDCLKNLIYNLIKVKMVNREVKMFEKKIFKRNFNGFWLLNKIVGKLFFILKFNYW